MTPLQAFIQHCQGVDFSAKEWSKHFDNIDLFEGDWDAELDRLTSQQEHHRQQVMESVDATAASVDDDTALLVLGVGAALRDNRFDEAWKGIEPKLKLAALRQGQEPDTDEIIDTHKAKELLGTKSNTSLRRWIKGEGFDSVTQGKYRLADILAVKARREAND